MTEQICVRCAKPGTKEVKLVWDKRGRLVHDPETDAEFDVCDGTAPGWSKCGACGLAHRSQTMFHAELLVSADAEGRIDPDRGRLVPFGTERAFHLRLPTYVDLFEAIRDDKVQPGTRGAILATDGNGEPWLIGQDCVDRTDYEDPKSWRRLKAAGTQERAGDEPIDAVPADGDWRDVAAIRALVGGGDRAARDLIRGWVADGRMEVSEAKTATGGTAKKLYRRPS